MAVIHFLNLSNKWNECAALLAQAEVDPIELFGRMLPPQNLPHRPQPPDLLPHPDLPAQCQPIRKVTQPLQADPSSRESSRPLLFELLLRKHRLPSLRRDRAPMVQQPLIVCVSFSLIQ